MIRNVTLNTLLFASLAIGLLQTAQAKVIALNNQSPGQCRYQLTHSNDPAPVVLAYMEGCPWANKLLPLYEQASNEMPNRTFFKYEYSGETGSNYLKAKTAHECLGAFPLYSPIVYIMNVMAVSKPELPGNINGIEKVGLDGAATKQDVIDFVKGKHQFQTRTSRSSIPSTPLN